MNRTPWFEDARERFERAGECPLIDDDEIIKREAGGDVVVVKLNMAWDRTA
jgi:hypothetical protein